MGEGTAWVFGSHVDFAVRIPLDYVPNVFLPGRYANAVGPPAEPRAHEAEMLYAMYRGAQITLGEPVSEVLARIGDPDRRTVNPLGDGSASGVVSEWPGLEIRYFTYEAPRSCGAAVVQGIRLTDPSGTDSMGIRIGGGLESVQPLLAEWGTGTKIMFNPADSRDLCSRREWILVERGAQYHHQMFGMIVYQTEDDQVTSIDVGTWSDGE